nr:hypothetical protein [Tanacetum cinerariifolium]
MNDSMIELRETFQAWLQQQAQVVNLDSYTPEPLQCQKIPIYYDDDDNKESSTSLRDIIISELPSCIAITPVLSTEEPVDSLIMEDEHFDTIPATEVDEDIDYVEASPPNSKPVSLEKVKDDILREKLLNINLLIAKIVVLNDNPTPDCVLKSPSSFPIPVKSLKLILGEPHVYVPNVLPSHPTFMLDLDFIPSDDPLGSDL